VVSQPASAADLAPVNPPPAPSVGGTTTIGLEASPEFNALSDSSHAAGSYADTEAKLAVTHAFAIWFVGGLLQLTVKSNIPTKIMSRARSDTYSISTSSS
jgi:hypothetical protein